MNRDLRSRRARRGSAAAAFATFAALTSHLLGGGSLPTFIGVIVPLALSTLACVLLAGRRLSLLRLSASVVLSQGLFHLLFSVFTPTHLVTGASNAVERQGLRHMGHDPGAAATIGDAGAIGDAATMTHSHASPLMVLMHLAAAAATIAVIFWAETLPTRLLDFARLVISALVPVIMRMRAVPDRPRQSVIIELALPRSLGILRSPVLRRGPPTATD